MSEFVIDYKINDYVKPENVHSWSSIGGGIYVKYDNIIITQTSLKNDDGYIGNWVFVEIMQLVDMIPLLVMGVKSNLEIEEETVYFSIEPKNGQIYFSVIPTNMDGTVDTELLSYYPCGLEGCPIPARLFLNGVYEMGSRFIDDVTSRYKNLSHSEIETFRIKLKLARDALENYNKTH